MNGSSRVGGIRYRLTICLYILFGRRDRRKLACKVTSVSEVLLFDCEIPSFLFLFIAVVGLKNVIL